MSWRTAEYRVNKASFEKTAFARHPGGSAPGDAADRAEAGRAQEAARAGPAARAARSSAGCAFAVRPAVPGPGRPDRGPVACGPAASCRRTRPRAGSARSRGARPAAFAASRPGIPRRTRGDRAARPAPHGSARRRAPAGGSRPHPLHRRAARFVLPLPRRRRLGRGRHLRARGSGNLPAARPRTAGSSSRHPRARGGHPSRGAASRPAARGRGARPDELAGGGADRIRGGKQVAGAGGAPG